MEIQQHDGVVVEVAGSQQGFAKRKRGGRGVTGGREAPGTWGRLPSLHPSLYRAPRGGAGPRRWDLLGGAAAKGEGGVASPTSQRGEPPTPRVSNPRRRGRPKGGAPAH